MDTADEWIAGAVGVVRLPDGTLVRGRGRWQPVPDGPLPEYGLNLGSPDGRPKWRLWRRTRPAPAKPASRASALPEPRDSGQPGPGQPGAATADWPAGWLDWPDFGVPSDNATAVAMICAVYDRARDGQRVEVTCKGGTGRTGTVLACMAILAGQPATEVVSWTRQHYRPRAIETRGQQRWIAWFAAHRVGYDGERGDSQE